MKVLDFDTLAGLAALADAEDPDFGARMAEEFLANAAGMLHDLETKALDRGEARRLLHQLRGAALNVGAFAFGEACHAAELRMARPSSVSDLAPHLKVLSATLQATQSAYSQLNWAAYLPEETTVVRTASVEIP